VVMSYDTMRADIEWLSSRPWGYCVLDEGHVIRNPKAKITQVLPASTFDTDLSRVPIHTADTDICTEKLARNLLRTTGDTVSSVH
jgi:hypothetical protein